MYYNSTSYNYLFSHFHLHGQLRGNSFFRTAELNNARTLYSMSSWTYSRDLFSQIHFSCENHKKIDRLHKINCFTVRLEFFYFSFYRPFLPNFFEIEKKIKEIFFQFYFFISLRLMPVQYWSSVTFFRFVFSIAARLIKLRPVTAPGEILPF